MNRDQLVSLVIEQTALLIPHAPTEVTESTDLVAELKLDSLGFVELSVVLEEATDINLDPERIAGSRTPGAIADLFLEALATA